VVVYEPGGVIIDQFEPEEHAIRLVEQDQTTVGRLGAIRVVSPPTYKDLSFTPPKGASILVSMVVAQYMIKHKDVYGKLYDVYVPDTGPDGAKRDEMGRIVGTYQLVRYL